MKKLVGLNIGAILALIIFFLVIYYFLLVNDFFSISSIISNAHHLAIKKHLLVLGLLPVYIAAMIFGSAVIATYLGSSIQNRISKAVRNSCSYHKVRAKK
ncbi:MAG: hypothetical protein JO149_06325 [Gammaproteobacteria bacterium]|nr:hypothetical protein [Gammaproteobacteria bacterium]